MAINHTHTYKRIRSRPSYYQCSHPDCSHYIHKSLITFKRATCPYCLDEFILEPRLLRLSVPHCSNCTASKDKKTKLSEEKLMENIARYTGDH